MLTVWQNVRFVSTLTVLLPLAFVSLTLLLLGLAVLVLPPSRHPSAFPAMGILRQVTEVLVAGQRTSARNP
ncbi:hypothetical protein [Streptomyces sp. NPDC006739]|uniref:hypothetical protein n=1 Tax=Streptomyces sp. NPDC006739 TaxID=3364763 RepID=UPI0036CDC3B0